MLDSSSQVHRFCTYINTNRFRAAFTTTLCRNREKENERRCISNEFILLLALNTWAKIKVYKVSISMRYFARISLQIYDFMSLSQFVSQDFVSIFHSSHRERKSRKNPVSGREIGGNLEFWAIFTAQNVTFHKRKTNLEWREKIYSISMYSVYRKKKAQNPRSSLNEFTLYIV